MRINQNGDAQSDQREGGTQQAVDYSARAAYEALASFYDEFTAHHDYDLWIGNLLPALESRGLTARGRLLDVGCGTGKSFLPMLDRGWSVAGCDISPAMIQVAEGKIDADRLELSVADMRDLPAFGLFDLVWCLDDGLNYLLDLDELRSALGGMAANLRAEGILVFDLNTLLTFRTFFADEVVVERTGKRMTWDGQADPNGSPGMVAEARLSIEPLSPDSGMVARRLSVHRERHFPESEVLETFDQVGLSCIDVFGIHYDAVLRQPLDEEQHTKAIYLAKRSV